MLTIEEKRERKSNYAKKHRERIRLYQIQYRNRNVQELKQYRALKKAKLSAYNAAYQIKNKDRIAKRKAENKAKNPEKVRVNNQRRRALKNKATVRNQKVILKWERKWRSLIFVRCFWCLSDFPPSQCHSDHIHSLKKGGVHSIENLCVSCGSCNHKKNAKTLEQWNMEIMEPVLF